jgi:hypothetical protein
LGSIAQAPKHKHQSSNQFKAPDLNDRNGCLKHSNFAF